MKNSGKFETSMRAVTIISEFSLPGLKGWLSVSTIVGVFLALCMR